MSDDQPARLTDALLEEIRAREQAATPGPWGCLSPLQAVVLANINKDGTTDEGDATETIGLLVGPESGAVGVVSITALAEYPDRDDVKNDPLWSDGSFIAHARSDIPALLAHIQALEAALAELRRACHLEMPEGERLSVSGYVCALCLWDADPDNPATHEPTCPLFVAGDAEGEAR